MSYLDEIRFILRPLIEQLSARRTHASIPTICADLGMPVPDSNGNVSKRERMLASFDAVPDAHLIQVASRYLDLHSPPAADRNRLQDALWSLTPAPDLSKRVRRDVVQAIESSELFSDSNGFDRLIESLFVLDDQPFSAFLGGNDRSLRAQIQRHVHRNPEDWSVDVLLDKLGAYEVSNERFARLIEGLASADVRPDETSQRRFVQTVNNALLPFRMELRETGTKDGYPVFGLVSTLDSHKRRPKNLIFGSSEKPDLRFRDALDNDVEIVTNADKVLIYDRPIGTEGLRWRELQAWWRDLHAISTDDEAKRSLYQRLKQGLPESSPPQRLLFTSYYKIFGDAAPDLPALLPEVWLHWDPKTVRKRGADALARLRMDFLLLLPRDVRVVLEVDGKHHYATDDGRADPARYSALVRADRELKLAGYQVFRFGAEELESQAKATEILSSFFRDLFGFYGVAVPAKT